MDNFSPEITYNNVSSWTHESNDVFSYLKSYSFTQTIGSSLSYSFNGVAIWYDYPSYHTMANLFRRYYGESGPTHGFFNVSIDGSTPQRLNPASNWDLSQRLLWSNVSLGPGRHNLTITHDDSRSRRHVTLDFFRSAINNVRREGQSPDSPYLPSLSSNTVVQCPPRHRSLNHEP